MFECMILGDSIAVGVLQNMIKTAEENNATIEILPEDTNWLELDYGL